MLAISPVEIIDGEVSHDRFLEIVNMDDASIIDAYMARNIDGEFLFVIISIDRSVYKFYGAGRQWSLDRRRADKWVYDTWRLVQVFDTDIPVDNTFKDKKNVIKLIENNVRQAISYSNQ